MSVLQSEFPEKITDKNSLITQIKQIIRDKLGEDVEFANNKKSNSIK